MTAYIRKRLMSNEICPLPWSLASADGSHCKTVPSKLLEMLTEGVEPAEDAPPTAVLIVDGMAALEAMKEIPGTFEESTTSVFHSCCSPDNLSKTH